MTRTTRSFMVMQNTWNEIGRQQHESMRFAHSAYAYKQAALYENLASDSRAFEEKAKNKQLGYQQWYNLDTTALFG